LILRRVEEERTKRVALLLTTLSSFLTPLSLSAVSIALPSIGRDLKLDAFSMSLIPTSYLLSSSIFLVPFGKLADIYGRKRIFLFGTLVFTIASLFAGLSQKFPMLLFFRVIQGVGGAMIFGTAVAILTSVFKEGERGKALGTNVAAVYLGLALGPFIGGLLTEHLSWRSVFFVNVPFGAIIVTFATTMLKREWLAEGGSIDYLGCLLYGFTILALVLGTIRLPAKEGLVCILIGTLLMYVFVRVELRAKDPLVKIDLFRGNRAFTFSNLAALINYSSTFATTFLLSLYLQFLRQMGPRKAGLVLVLQPFVQAIVSPIAGRLSDRIEPRMLASLGMALTSLGLFQFSCLKEDSTSTFLLFGLLILGVGFGIFSSPNTNAVMGAVSGRYYGIASSILATMRLLGQMFSMGVATTILSVYVGKAEISPESYPLLLRSIKTTFLVSACLSLFGILASLSRGTKGHIPGLRLCG